uniref:Uncharacterized protein n=1 Tax=Ficedula albicollis TaxID=59894 RepID=A0A803VPW5_FICAL
RSKVVHIGLLEGLMLAMLINNFVKSKETSRTKCYHPLYDGESLGSLIRVHTNINPSCFNHSQITTCQEGGKVYWTARNTASFRQRLLGRCPVVETWFCFEHEASQGELTDMIKERQLVVATKKENKLEIPVEKNLFINLVGKKKSVKN